MGMATTEIRSLTIVGGGTAGWMTAAALAKVMGPRVQITLIESEEIGTIGVGEATIPAISLFNTLLRIDEDEFVRETQASFKLGIEFVNWKARGHGYMHSFGTLGKDLGPIPFHHYWMEDQISGARSDLWDYSIDYLAARAGRFARMPQIEGTPLPGLIYAFHFDASLYAAYLRRYAERLGVKRIEGKIGGVKRDAHSGDIASVTLESGAELASEFWVDCSGFRGLLIEGALEAGYDDWSHWLACDRALAVPCESASPLTPYTRSTAHEAGWQWRIPLQHRTGNGHVYSSSFISDERARDVLMNNLDGKPLAEPRPIRFKTGRRRKLWSHNCVAIGLSSGFLEPLESTSIHLIQSSIERLIMLFPQQGDNQRLRDEYNKVGITEFEFIRDFIILHYHLNEREGEPFWDYCRNMSVPDTLTHKIELFRESCAIHPTPHDLFQLPSWLQVMWGQGITPKASHPFVQTIAPRDRAEYLQGLRDIMAHEVTRLPTHEQFIARHCAAKPMAPA
jgi:tryptophan halogenase